jgi:hypothetical protein
MKQGFCRLRSQSRQQWQGDRRIEGTAVIRHFKLERVDRSETYPVQRQVRPALDHSPASCILTYSKPCSAINLRDSTSSPENGSHAQGVLGPFLIPGARLSRWNKTPSTSGNLETVWAVG